MRRAGPRSQCGLAMTTRAHVTPTPTPASAVRAVVAHPATATRAGVLRGARLARFIGVELLVWTAFYGAYLAVRGLSIGSTADAMRHAHDVVGAERTLGLFHEASVQSLLSPVEGFLSTYYMLGFGPLLGVVLVWLACRRPAAYRDLRTALLVSVAVASVVFILFPTAPPRLVEGLGIADTVGLSGHDTGSFMGIRFNPYAAMPSMHVGWSLLLGVHGVRVARSRALRAFFAIHPVLMTLTVLATGNHYLLDAAAGAAIACAVLLLMQAAPAIRARARRPLIVAGPTGPRLEPLGRK